MSRRLIVFAPVAALAFVATLTTAAPKASLASWSPIASHPAEQGPGRYKQGGNVCEWDAKDTGPNQCEPIVKGRFTKGDKDACTWDANGRGADDCRPPKGRWKAGKDDSVCAWDANDGGPDQCNPRRVKK